jgi:hypothetical protein
MIREIPKKAANVTPSDTNYLTDQDGVQVIGSLYIGVSGDLAVLLEENTNTNIAITTGTSHVMLFKSVAVGPFPYSVKKVFSTGTTATNIVVAYD